MHKYHVYNDKHQWPIILSTTAKYGEITHSDYSENMSQMYKEEAQSRHFNKSSYSLHCTVEHINREKHLSIPSPYCYLYHFSNDMKHDYAFTATVAHSCLALNNLPHNICQKSGNLGIQYKSQYVFSRRSTHTNQCAITKKKSQIVSSVRTDTSFISSLGSAVQYTFFLPK